MLGPTGQLGRELLAVPSPPGVRITPLGRDELDLARSDRVFALIEEARPTLVINAAAWTDVDGAEGHPVTVRRLNSDAVAHLARACAAVDAGLIQVSTDYVFGGDRPSRTPWTEDDPLDPRGVYARTKAAGEIAVREALPETGVVVRTAWLYSAHGRNFARTMLAKARAGEHVRVVDDQWGQPTWACDVARQVIALGERLLDGRAPAGNYHATNAGEATWWEFARRIYSLAGADPELVAPMASSELDRPAPRPAWSVLGHDRWGEADLPAMRPWGEALEAAMPGIEGAQRH